MIPAERLHDAGYVFDSEMNEWVHENADEQSKVVYAQDDTMEFVVDKIHEVAGTISIEGSKPAHIK